jgi:hypothetical protein
LIKNKKLLNYPLNDELVNPFKCIKMRLLLVFTLLLGTLTAQAQEVKTQNFNEWRIVTVVESIIPMGLGRSRMIENMTDVNTEDFRTSRVNGKQSSQRTISRKELKVDKFDEAKLLNFFSAAGINFQNIASNDAMIAARIMELESEGYTLAYVSSAVESYAGKQDENGIFISRMYFKKSVPAK